MTLDLNSSQVSTQTLQLQNSMELPTPWTHMSLDCCAFYFQSWQPNIHFEQLQLHLELTPPGVLEWSSSRQSWSHPKEGLSWRLGLGIRSIQFFQFGLFDAWEFRVLKNEDQSFQKIYRNRTLMTKFFGSVYSFHQINRTSCQPIPVGHERVVVHAAASSSSPHRLRHEEPVELQGGERRCRCCPSLHRWREQGLHVHWFALPMLRAAKIRRRQEELCQASRG